MPLDPGHDRLDRRDLDAIVALDQFLVGRAQGGGAVRAVLGHRAHHLVRRRIQRARHPAAPLAPLTLAARRVGLVTLRRRRAGIARCLGRLGELLPQLRDPPFQLGVDLESPLKPRRLFQDQGVLPRVRELAEIDRRSHLTQESQPEPRCQKNRTSCVSASTLYPNWSRSPGGR